jgi:ketosteroid isomerase-like protein
MRQFTIGLLAVAAVVSLSACATQAPPQEFGKEDVAQLRQMLAEFVTAYNAKDVEKIGALFSANSALMPPNRSTLRGVDVVKSYFDGRWKDDGATNLAVEPLTIEGHGPLGFIAGTFSLELKGPDGSGTGRDRGKVMWIVHKYSEKWKFEWQMMSSDLPPAVPQIAPETKPGAPVKK